MAQFALPWHLKTHQDSEVETWRQPVKNHVVVFLRTCMASALARVAGCWKNDVQSRSPKKGDANNMMKRVLFIFIPKIIKNQDDPWPRRLVSFRDMFIQMRFHQTPSSWDGACNTALSPEEIKRLARLSFCQVIKMGSKTRFSKTNMEFFGDFVFRHVV